MGLRFRKSVKLTDGVKANISTKSASVSIGKKGARYNISTTGKRTATVGIPGTGLSYSVQTNKKKSTKKRMSKGKRVFEIAIVIVAFVIIGVFLYKTYLKDFIADKFNSSAEADTSEGSVASDSDLQAGLTTYVLNTKSHKLHLPGCGSVSSISDENKKEVQAASAEAFLKENSEYTLCGTCKPK